MMNSEAIAEAQQLYGAAVGDSKADYYVPKFIDFDGFHANRASWNWPAFFFTFPWMLYRRMFGYAAVYFLAVPLVVGVMTALVTIFGDPRAVTFINVVISLLAFFGFVPMYANAMYHATVARRIGKAQGQTQDLEEQVRLLRQAKSTSIAGVIVGVILVGGPLGARVWSEVERYQAKVALSQVEQGPLRVGWLQAAIESHYLQHQRWPKDASGFGLDANANGKYISAIAVEDGAIRIEYGNEAAREISGRVLVLEPRVLGRRFEWRCREVTDTAIEVPRKLWPDKCLDQDPL